MTGIRALITTLLMLGLTALLPHMAQAAAPVVSGLSVQSAPNIDRIELQLSQAITYKSFELDNPPRLVIDMPALEWRAGNGLPAGYSGRILRNIRVARFNATTTRMVLDLAQPVSLDEVAIQNQGVNAPFIMRFDVVTAGYAKGSKDSAATWQQNAPSPSAIRDSKAEPSGAKPPQDWVALAETMRTPVPLPAGLPFTTVPVPVFRPAGTYMPTVVIDAGHGGRDPGTTGRRGTREKHVTLVYARALAEALRATGRYKVVLTRDDDSYIMLRERLAIGRRTEGDVFISIHADAAENSSTRGFSIYTLSENASDAEAAALAARENKVDLIYGMNLSTENKDVTEILIDLAQRETKNKSTKLADIIVEHVGKKVQLLRNTHRYAGFAVLKAPDVPSVLIELGFLSNRKDEALITSSNYREGVVSALVNGIDAYFEMQRSR